MREARRGEDFFRSAVIEALGDYKAAYAFDAVMAIAKLDGPLLDDAALALGKIGDQPGARDAGRPAAHRAAGLRSRSSPRRSACSASTASRTRVTSSRRSKFSDQNIGFQELLRGAASGLGALGVCGRERRVDALFDVGIPSRDPTRAPVALALATIALRNTPLMLAMLKAAPARATRSRCSREGFDMLEEDLDKERFFALVRRDLLGIAGRVRRPAI